MRRLLFWPPSIVYISVIITHKLHIKNHAGPSVWAAIHVLYSVSILTPNKEHNFNFVLFLSESLSGKLIAVRLLNNGYSSFLVFIRLTTARLWQPNISSFGNNFSSAAVWTGSESEREREGSYSYSAEIWTAKVQTSAACRYSTLPFNMIEITKQI